MTRRLPPLNAVRAFEASARLRSLALAAAELCVTPGAVSQQVRKLEDFYGRQLLVRRNGQLLLTDLGQSVYGTCSELMDQLAAMTRRIVGGSDYQSLVVSVLPSVGIRWLNRRLPEFIGAHPDLRVDLRLEEDPVDFFRTRIDVRISYGEHIYPEFVTTPFARDRVTVMCAPGLVESGRVRPADALALADEDLIHILWRTGFSAYPTWESWFAEAGFGRTVRTELGHKTDISSLAIDLASAGAGVVLGQYMLAGDALEAGALVAPFETAPALPYLYCAVHTPAELHNPMVRRFVDWLVGVGTGI
ncbi:MAG: LysR family transcriptional regulator [Proteobacteria bacterium]|nr:LysR family transcriptional regulator [Pseudomonadota bacterium]